MEARKAAQQRGANPGAAQPKRTSDDVVHLTERRPASLPGDNRPLPTVDQYDALLRRRTGSA